MRDFVRFALRLPLDVHEALKELAERENRSLHGQIIHLLRLALAKKEDRDAAHD